MIEIENKQIISWLYDKAARAQDHSYARMLNMAAKRLQELDQAQSVTQDVTQDVTQNEVNVSDTNVVKWTPVTERLPDLELVEVRAEDMDLFPCLVVKAAPQAPKKRFVTKAWYDGNGFMDTDCIWVTKSVTHWMPLPEPPKEEDDG